MKIMVTGGAGFIGSHVVDWYIKEGHEVVIVDNLSSGKENNINPLAKFYLVDIRSPEIEKVFALEKPDIVNHHAAQKSVPASVDDPYTDADINLLGFLRLLDNCVKFRVKKVIAISSGGALAGDADTIPTNESTSPSLESPYAISKYMSEKYLSFYAQTHGLDYLVLRYANVYGPRQIPDGECGVIPIFFHNYFAGQPSYLMAYDDQPEGTTRDYVYVDDVARANLLALQYGRNEMIHIGSGIERHIAHIYDEMKRVLQHDLPLIRKGPRIGDVKRSCLDPSKAKRILGWEAKISLSEGIRLLYEDYINRYYHTFTLNI
jgi:UDP-glucose 4-epimerase